MDGAFFFFLVRVVVAPRTCGGGVVAGRATLATRPTDCSSWCHVWKRREAGAAPTSPSEPDGTMTISADAAAADARPELLPPHGVLSTCRPFPNKRNSLLELDCQVEHLERYHFSS